MHGYRDAKSYCLVLVILVCLGLTGCENKATQENFDKIEFGMSRRQVEKILGKGDDVDSNTTVWRNGNSQYTITFTNGLVSGKGTRTESGGGSPFR